MAGGSNLEGTSNNTAELYNPVTGKWSATTSMPSGRTAPVTRMLSGKVLVSGGGGSGSGGLVHDPSTAQWTATGPLNYGGGTGETATLLTNGDVLMYGNKFSCYAGQYYTPSTNTWARTQGQCGNNVSSGPLVDRLPLRKREASDSVLSSRPLPTGIGHSVDYTRALVISVGTFSTRAKWRSFQSVRSGVPTMALDRADIVRDGRFSGDYAWPVLGDC